MSDTERDREIRIEKRARALAMMLLTHRPDLLIEEVADLGLDFIVRFNTEKEGMRELGVKVRGARAAMTKEQADKALRPSMQQIKRHGPFTRPVCLFFFTMEYDGAWYTWVAEPTESDDGKPTLRSCDAPDCRLLDKRAVKEIVERVDSWFNAVYPSLVVNGANGKKGERQRVKR